MISGPQPKTLQVHSISQWDDIAPLARSWNELCADNFMLSTFWLGAWWQAFGEQRNAQLSPVERSKLSVGRVEDAGGKVCGFVPGFVSRSLLGRTFRLLGSGTACSDYLRLLSPPSGSLDIGRAAGDWLTSRNFRLQYGRLDAVELEGCSGDDLSIKSLAKQLEIAGWNIERQSLEGAWRLPLPNSWDVYEKSLPKSRRRKVNKAKRLLTEGTVKYTAVSTPEELDRFWPDFVALHQKRRTALGQAGCFADPHFFVFLYQAAQRLLTARRGWLSLLFNAGRPVAASLIFTADRTAYMYQSGMDVDRADLEPGHLINTFSLQTAIESGYQWFDFLRGDEPYKEGWNAERIPLDRIRAFAPHLTARLRQTAIAAGRSLRAWTDTWTNLARP